MVKSTSLNSDVNFIKEFEELKLKQRLLIDSLSKKNKEDRNSLLMEISSKLDFLVKIFKEAQDSENDYEHVDQKFKEILEKLDSVEEKVNTKFSTLEDKFEDLKISTSKITNPVLDEPKKEENSNLDQIPPPDKDLGDDVAKKVDENINEDSKSSNESSEKKKRKWF